MEIYTHRHRNLSVVGGGLNHTPAPAFDIGGGVLKHHLPPGSYAYDANIYIIIIM